MIKLLVVDDESATRKGLMKHMNWEALGIQQVEEARDGIEGLEISGRFEPDIVLSDIRMPGMDGIEFATNIRAQFPECRIIFLSGYSDKEYLKAAIHLNAVSYVEKPINLEELKDVLKKAVALCVENEKKKLTEQTLHSALSESLPFIKQNAALNLIGRKAAPEEALKDLQLARVPFSVDDIYTVLILKPAFKPETTPEDRQSCCNDVLAALEECLHGITHICTMKDSSHIILIAQYDMAVNRKKIFTLFEILKAQIAQSSLLSSNLFCAVGQTVSGMARIRESYETAVQAAQKLFFQGYGHIVFYENKPVESTAFDESVLASFSQLLQEQKKEHVTELIEKLCRDLKAKEDIQVDEAKNIFFKLAFTLLKEAEKRGLRFGTAEDHEGKFLWALISDFQTLREIKDYLIGKSIQILEGIEDLESRGRAVFNVMKYIQKNYSSADLSVKILADHVYLTPTYLSALFKKETGKTIGEYLAEVRIEQSKTFLLDPRIKLFEVARKTGYSDANYYAKAFKKQIGLTPSEFREKYIS